MTEQGGLVSAEDFQVDLQTSKHLISGVCNTVRHVWEMNTQCTPVFISELLLNSVLGIVKIIQKVWFNLEKRRHSNELFLSHKN